MQKNSNGLRVYESVDDKSFFGLHLISIWKAEFRSQRTIKSSISIHDKQYIFIKNLVQTEQLFNNSASYPQTKHIENIHNKFKPLYM